MKSELQSVLDLARSLPAAELPAFLGELEQVRVTAFARLATPAAEPAREDVDLGVAEASKRLGVSKSYLYHNAHKFKFARREGAKLLFNSVGLDTYRKRTKTTP